MAIIKESKIGKIEIVGEFKAVQVLTDIFIKENEKIISQTKHRHVLLPDSDITKESQEVKDVCNTVWTQEVKSAYEQFKQEQENKLGS